MDLELDDWNAEDRVEKQREAIFQLEKFRLETRIAAQQEIADNEDEFLLERLSANKEVAKLTIDLAKLEEKFITDNKKTAEAEKTRAVEESTLKQQQAEDQLLENKVKIYADDFKNKLQSLNDLNEAQKLQLQKDENTLKESLLSQGVSVEEINKQITALRRESLGEQLQNQIDFAPVSYTHLTLPTTPYV